MKIGLIDVDNRDNLYHCYPNLVLMKISAWHKNNGDTVEWYDPMFGGWYDIVYMSKVFSFTPDFEYGINADKIVKGGSGYAIHIENGKEVYGVDSPLPTEIEHIMPDYTIYWNDETDFQDGKLTKVGKKHRETAYGFMSRGCPRGCDFCHVKSKEGLVSVKVADLDEFWSGQKYISLHDPNVLACSEWDDILGQLARSHAKVDFNQGLDIRMMTQKKAEMLNEIRIEKIHFAWDRWQDKDLVIPKFLQYREVSSVHSHDLQVYVLTNFDTTHEQDLFRIEWLKDHGFAPYVMIYNKESLPKGHITRKLQRYVNARSVFWSIDSFDDYQKRRSGDVSGI